MLLEVLTLPPQEYMYQIYMLLEVLTLPPQEHMYLIYMLPEVRIKYFFVSNAYVQRNAETDTS